MKVIHVRLADEQRKSLIKLPNQGLADTCLLLVKTQKYY
jgi:hypothetical protein